MKLDSRRRGCGKATTPGALLHPSGCSLLRWPHQVTRGGCFRQNMLLKHLLGTFSAKTCIFLCKHRSGPCCDTCRAGAANVGAGAGAQPRRPAPPPRAAAPAPRCAGRPPCPLAAVLCANAGAAAATCASATTVAPWHPRAPSVGGGPPQAAGTGGGGGGATPAGGGATRRAGGHDRRLPMRRRRSDRRAWGARERGAPAGRCAVATPTATDRRGGGTRGDDSTESGCALTRRARRAPAPSRVSPRPPRRHRPAAPAAGGRGRRRRPRRAPLSFLGGGCRRGGPATGA